MTSPQWFRMQSNWLENPKIAGLHESRDHAAIVLWLDSIAYAGLHLTDGWVPAWFPKRRGYRTRDCDALLKAELWHVLVITDQGGWLINDYLKYQRSRDQWETVQAKRAAAAKARWNGHG